MSDAKQLVTTLLKNNNIQVPADRKQLLNQFVQDEANLRAISTIIKNQDQLMTKWKLENRIADIRQQSVRIPNGTVGKPYEARFDFDLLSWKDITEYEFEGLQNIGLHYDSKIKLITGTPAESGDHKIIFKFKISGQPAELPFNEKIIPLIINPDPRSLWKTLESDKADPWWKQDDVTIFSPLGPLQLLVSSKRGRSHANVGSFREDDFAFSELENGWSIVVVADGAGSAKASRKGSSIACNAVVEYFKEPAAIDNMKEFDQLIPAYKNNTGEETAAKINRLVYNNLGKAVFQVHKNLEEFAATNNLALKDLNSTLIFTLIKKYQEGFAFLSFGVGDCPIAIINKDKTEVILMNWLDVGEFGGGTRFITMAEIFKSDKFASRFGFKLMDDFSYLMLMSDGIYDPKFVVENSLADIKKWHQLLADLGGKNEDGVAVVLDKDNPDIVEQFSRWMDFWSPGNHDDRTLAIVF
ncbi:PP2C family serine/threonine-protein phosphatase [Flavitalea sp.]|nr:PP2C family serine/threonine-protein phosphatase [Flavitalea sp.]